MTRVEKYSTAAALIAVAFITVFVVSSLTVEKDGPVVVLKPKKPAGSGATTMEWVVNGSTSGLAMGPSLLDNCELRADFINDINLFQFYKSASGGWDWNGQRAGIVQIKSGPDVFTVEHAEGATSLTWTLQREDGSECELIPVDTFNYLEVPEELYDLDAKNLKMDQKLNGDKVDLEGEKLKLTGI